MSFEFLEHPSDIIVLAKGSKFESALADVANGMFTQMGAENAEEKESFDLDFSAPTQDQLVVQLLTEIIAECETRPLTPKRMEVLSCQFPVSSSEPRIQDTEHRTRDTRHRTRDTVSSSQFRVSVRVHGEKKVPENIIKAVTYNSLRIEEKDGWEIQVLFDI